MCGERPNVPEVTFDITLRIEDVYHYGEEIETQDIIHAMEDLYGDDTVEVRKFEVISTTDPSTGIVHYAGVEG